MRMMFRLFTLAAAAVLVSAAPAAAQAREGLMGELIRDVTQVEKKVMDLAKAMPASAFEWRPATGVRSTAEVLQHIAADNYLLPAMMGIAAPSDTGITKEYSTAAAYEKRTLTREALLAELEKSFGFLKSAMTGMSDEQMNTPVEVFGQKNTNRGMWVLTVGHLHEHLGQLIAYARSNKVTPPWSK